MAKIIFEFEDSVRDELVQAVCMNNGYHPDSGRTPGEFTTDKVIEFCRDQILMYRREVAFKNAVASVTANAADILSENVVNVTTE